MRRCQHCGREIGNSRLVGSYCLLCEKLLGSHQSEIAMEFSGRY